MDWAGRRAREPDRRVRRHPDPLGHQAHRRPDRQGHQPRVVGRAGVGVDNVDVDAATKRGVVVANAPQSNVITAAEHTIALLLALARRVPQAHALADRRRLGALSFSGVELYEKTLGVLGFGRIGQLVAQRALGFGMHVVAFDAYVAEERFREVGVERAESSDELYDRADFVTIHLPVTEETANWLDADAFARMKDGVRVINVARGGLLVDDDLQGGARLGQGRRRGARRLPRGARDRAPAVRLSERGRHPAPGRLHHRGHRPRRLPGRRAGRGGAHRRHGHLRRQHSRRSPPRTWRRWAASCRSRATSAGSPSALAEGTSVDALEVEYRGRIAERDTRLLTVQVLKGVLAGHTEEEINDVNAPAIAQERGIAVTETSTSPGARLHRPGARGRGQRRRAHPGGRHHARQRAPLAPARGLELPLQPPARGPPGDLPLRGPPRHARPGGHRARRGGHQHRLRRGRPRLRGRRQRRRPRWS